MTDSFNIKTFICGLSNSENEHICENPRTLSCNHYVCRSCWKADVSQNQELNVTSVIKLTPMI